MTPWKPLPGRAGAWVCHSDLASLGFQGPELEWGLDEIFEFSRQVVGRSGVVWNAHNKEVEAPLVDPPVPLIQGQTGIADVHLILAPLESDYASRDGSTPRAKPDVERLERLEHKRGGRRLKEPVDVRVLLRWN
jgi:hypothetical protein